MTHEYVITKPYMIILNLVKLVTHSLVIVVLFISTQKHDHMLQMSQHHLIVSFINQVSFLSFLVIYHVAFFHYATHAFASFYVIFDRFTIRTENWC